MKDFEGFKKIKNEKNYMVSDLYNMLSPFEEYTGKIETFDNYMTVDVDGKYLIEIIINEQNQIIIKRQLEENQTDNKINLGEDIKTIDMSQADRMIEQIYDLIMNNMTDSELKEPITGVKKIYFIEKQNNFLADTFNIKNEKNEIVYQAKENKLLKEYKIKNNETKFELATINFTGHDFAKYSIQLNSYHNINVSIDNSHTESVKNLLRSKINGKDLVAKADYTDNHYNIELDEIVIGAIDLLNDTQTPIYRIEINDNNFENIIISLAIIIYLHYKS